MNKSVLRSSDVIEFQEEKNSACMMKSVPVETAHALLRNMLNNLYRQFLWWRRWHDAAH